jgi:hypothetical protein
VAPLGEVGRRAFKGQPNALGGRIYLSERTIAHAFQYRATGRAVQEKTVVRPSSCGLFFWYSALVGRYEACAHCHILCCRNFAQLRAKDARERDEIKPRHTAGLSYFYDEPTLHNASDPTPLRGPEGSRCQPGKSLAATTYQPPGSSIYCLRVYLRIGYSRSDTVEKYHNFAQVRFCRQRSKICFAFTDPFRRSGREAMAHEDVPSDIIC